MNNNNKEARRANAREKLTAECIVNPQQIKGNERYAIWLYNEPIRQYEWINHYPTEKLARDVLAKHNLELSDVDLRLEEYYQLENCWKCTQHIKE